MRTPNPMALLLRRGDLLVRSPLAYADARAAMLSALYALDRRYSQRASSDPGIALVEALAATLEVMAFYHDRIATESKVETAILLESIAWLGQVIGFRPKPPVAAVGYQFFEAIAPGTVIAGTQVSGSAGDPPVDVIFETSAAIPIAPAYNRMALSPLVDRAPGALRAVISLWKDPTEIQSAALRAARATLPPDDFPRGVLAMVRPEKGDGPLELCPVDGSRTRAVAFARPLCRSYPPSDTVVHRSTQTRHLRFWWPLGQNIDADLVTFEVTADPILHLPDPNDLTKLTSTLEVFVFTDPAQEIGDPSTWDPADAWAEVPDFSQSSASDKHYRTFVDDRMTTYLLLRRTLGYRTLLSDEVLGRVYVRFTSAIGWAAPSRALRLDADYYKSSIAQPTVAGKPAPTSTTWVVTATPSGIRVGEQIAILGGASGEMYFRRITQVSGPRLSWAFPALPLPPLEIDYAPVNDVFNPDSTKIARLADVAAGQHYPLHYDFYAQAQPPLVVEASDPNAPMRLERRICEGSLFIFLDDTSKISMGGYVLIGARLTAPCRPDPSSGSPPSLLDSYPSLKNYSVNFSSHAPWIIAEVVQAVEVRGNLVQLKSAITQDYYAISIKDLTKGDSSEWILAVDVIAVPAVASVFYGDSFEQSVTLSAAVTFPGGKEPGVPTLSIVPLTQAIKAEILHRQFSKLPPTWDQVFLAISGSKYVESLSDVTYMPTVEVENKGLRAQHLAALEAPDNTILSATSFQAEDDSNKIRVDLSPEHAAKALQQKSKLVMQISATTGPVWTVITKGNPGKGQCLVLRTEFTFKPLTPPDLSEGVLSTKGTLLVTAEQPAKTISVPFTVDSNKKELLLTGDIGDVPSNPSDVTAVSGVPPLDTSGGNYTWTAALSMAAPPNVTGTGPVVLELTSGTLSPPRCIWDASQGNPLSISGVPVALGKEPLADVRALQLLAAANVAITGNDLWEIWRFQPSTPLRTTPFKGLVALTFTSGKLLLAEAVDESGALRITVKTGEMRAKFPTETLTEVSALLTSAAKSPTPRKAWVLTDASGQIGSPDDETKAPTCPRPAVAFALEGSNASATASSGDWWWNGATLCREIKRPFRSAPSGTVATLVEYYNVPIEADAFRFQDSKLIIDIPSDFAWNDDNGAPNGEPPAAFLLFMTNGSYELYALDAPPRVPVPSAQIAVTLVNGRTTSLLWKRLYFVRRDLSDASHRSTITPFDALRVNGMEAWGEEPAHEDSLGLHFTKSDAPATRLSTQRFTDKKTKELLFVLRSQQASLPASFDDVHVSIQSWGAPSPGTLVDQHGAIQLPAGALQGVSINAITEVAFEDTQPGAWTRVTASPISGEPDVLSLGETLAKLAVSLLDPPPVSLIVAEIPLSAVPAEPRWMQLMLDGKKSPPNWLSPLDSHANALVLLDNKSPPLSLVATPSTVPKTGQGFTVALSPDANKKFDLSQGLPSLVLSPGQRWRGTEGHDFTFTSAGLKVQLGPADLGVDGQSQVTLAVGDQLSLTMPPPTDAITTKITEVNDNNPPPIYTLDQDPGGTPTEIRLVSVQTSATAGGFAVDLSSTSLHDYAPWLLTFDSTGPLNDKPLVYGKYTAGPPTTLTFTDPASVSIIFDKLAAVPAEVYVYTNQSSALFKSFYTGDHDKADPRNFITQSTGSIKELCANPPGILGTTGSPPWPRVLLRSVEPLTASTAADLGSLIAQTGKRSTGTGNYLAVVSQSIVFNSGNFIPVIGSGIDNDARVIVNAIRVHSEDGNNTLMTYDPTLSDLVEAIELGTATYNPSDNPDQPSTVSYGDPSDPDTQNVPLPKQSYSFQKTADGTFTLNFLICYGQAASGNLDEPQHKVRLIVQYYAPPVHSPETSGDRLYEFETGVPAWKPSTEIVVLDSGSLEPGDLLFLRDATSKAPIPFIQWTQITQVNGPVVTIDRAFSFEREDADLQDVPARLKLFVDAPRPHSLAPPLKLFVDVPVPPYPAPRAGAVEFLRYSLSGAADPSTKLALDADYYAAMKGAVLAGDGARLALGDHLVFDPSGLVDHALLDEIIPGDRLLFWDERARDAYRRYRRTGAEPLAGGDGISWSDLPDLEFETTVKAVNPATGLIVLSDRLPEGFSIPCNAGAGQPVVPAPTAVAAIRALPHYREPFQGPRVRAAVGSGDKTHLFPRYTGSLDPATGMGSLPLALEGVFASNLEVLVLEPRSGEWSRWIQFADLRNAKAQHLAFQLGVDAGRLASGAPFSLCFGDGKTGQLLPTGTDNVFVRQTQIAAWAKRLPGPRRLHVFDVEAPPSGPLPWPGPLTPVLRCLVAFSAPLDYRPLDDQDPWQSSIAIETIETIETIDGDHKKILWTETTSVPCAEGLGRIFVQRCRPGVVEVFFLWPSSPVQPIAIRAFALPDARLWTLDEAFYKAMDDSDLSRAASATSLQLLETEGIAPGSILALTPDDASPAEIATIKAVDIASYSATLEAPLARSYPLATSSLRGNIAAIVQGSSESIVLGAGDGRTKGLRFQVRTKDPILFVASDDSAEPAPAITVLVDGIPWTRVLELAGEGPRDRVYRLDIDPDGSVFVTFGDGQAGAIPSPGFSNITALVRTGYGGLGNLPADAIDTLRDGNLAVAKTTNLTETTGGYAGDTADDARAALLDFRTGDDRVVTTGDLVRAACHLGEAIHARLRPAPFGEIRLVVALADRSTPTTLTLATLKQRLTKLLPAAAGMTLTISGASQRSVYLIVRFAVTAGYRQADVLAALGQAFSAAPGGFFAADRWPIAHKLLVGDVYEAIFAVKGVGSADIVWLSVNKPNNDGTAIVDPAIDPGPTGVIRCDNDLAGDPRSERGTITFSPIGAPTP